MVNDERIILTINAKGDTTFCVESLKDMSPDQLKDLAYNLNGILLSVVQTIQKGVSR
jgi:hypothetical protein